MTDKPFKIITSICLPVIAATLLAIFVSSCSTRTTKAKDDTDHQADSVESQSGPTGFSSKSGSSNSRGSKTPPSVPLESVTSASGTTYRFAYVGDSKPVGGEQEITIAANALSDEYSTADLLSRKVGVESTDGIWMMADGKPYELPARGSFRIPDGVTKVKFFSSKAFKIKLSE